MSADIVEKLAADLQDYADGLGSAPIIVHDRAELYGLLVRAAAEIGRLRGEGRVPAGWRMVPDDPTREMVEAGVMFGNSPNKATIIYQSMLNAAPNGPPPEAIAPAEAKDPAPAMPNGVEDMHDDLSTPDLLNEAERIAVNQHKDGRYAAARILRILCHRLRAADNRDAAGVPVVTHARAPHPAAWDKVRELVEAVMALPEDPNPYTYRAARSALRAKAALAQPQSGGDA